MRERHPDVDVVVLPRLEADLPPATAEQAGDLVGRGRTTLSGLHERLGREPTAHVALWWQQEQPDVHRLVVRESYRDLGPDAAVQLLRDLGDALLAQGWTAGPVAGPAPALQGSGHGDLEISARAVGGSVDLEMRSAPVRLDAAQLPDPTVAR